MNSKLESDGGNPVYKNRSVAKLIELKEKYTLTDIWRIRNPYVKRYNLKQNHFSGFIQHGLDCIFISNSIQEYIDAWEKWRKKCRLLKVQQLFTSRRKFYIQSRGIY